LGSISAVRYCRHIIWQYWGGMSAVGYWWASLPVDIEERLCRWILKSIFAVGYWRASLLSILEGISAVQIKEFRSERASGVAGGPLQLSTLVSSRANCPFGCVSRPRLHLGRKRSRRGGPELSSEILALASQRQRRPSQKSSEIRYWPRFVPTAPRGENQFPVSSRQPSILH